MENTGLSKRVMFGELMRGAGVTEDRKKSRWGVSWTTSELLVSKPTSESLKPRARGNGARRWDKGRTFSWRNQSLQRKPGLDYGACSSMSERDGKNQREDSPKQGCSCWFVHHT